MCIDAYSWCLNREASDIFPDEMFTILSKDLWTCNSG